MAESQEQSNALGGESPMFSGWADQNASGAEATLPPRVRSVSVEAARVLARIDSLSRLIDEMRARLDVTPVEVIDLTNSDRPANNRAPDDDEPSPPKRVCPNCDQPQEEEPYKCPVCLESVRMREPVATKCGHVFCKDCLIDAISSFHKCPLCNKKLTQRQFKHIYL